MDNQPKTPDYIFIRNDNKEYEKIALTDIMYISGEAEYLAFHISGRDKPLREKISFGDTMLLLPDEFVKIHRSAVINMRHVSRVGTMYVVMDDGTRFRVSDGHRARFYAQVAARTVSRRPATGK